MPKKADADVPHTVTIMYNKGDDDLHFKSRASADAAVEKIREDLSSTYPTNIITVEDDHGKTINFRNKNFDRTISKPTTVLEGWP
jgi:hypothetical protein